MILIEHIRTPFFGQLSTFRHFLSFCGCEIYKCQNPLKSKIWIRLKLKGVRSGPHLSINWTIGGRRGSTNWKGFVIVVEKQRVLTDRRWHETTVWQTSGIIHEFFELGVPTHQHMKWFDMWCANHTNISIWIVGFCWLRPGETKLQVSISDSEQAPPHFLVKRAEVNLNHGFPLAVPHDTMDHHGILWY